MNELENAIDVVDNNDDGVIDSIITRTVTEFIDDDIASVGKSAFRGCTALTKVVLPSCIKLDGEYYMGGYNFAGCTNLQFVSLNSLKTASTFAFNGAGTTALDQDGKPRLEIYLPSVSTLSAAAFFGAKVKIIDTRALSSIDANCFQGGEVTHLVLRNNRVCNVTTPAYLGNVSNVYVPSAFVAEYEASDKWEECRGRFLAIEDFTVDGSIDGAFDFNKAPN